MATNGNSNSIGSVVVISAVPKESLVYDEVTGQPIISAVEQLNDDMDPFNHPRLRRALILTALKNKYSGTDNLNYICPGESALAVPVNLDLYKSVHSEGLVTFLSQAWKRWDHLGEEGQDIMCIMETVTLTSDTVTSTDTTVTTIKPKSPPLIPGCVPFSRDPHFNQRSGGHVMGQVGYFCTDTCTPIFGDMLEELVKDGAVVQRAVDVAMLSAAAKNLAAVNMGVGSVPVATVYAIPTHPGHHAANDSFGGYCYVNHAALAARLFQQQRTAPNIKKVAVLDIDYHAGNGTASIFYEDPTVLVVSIHCHPDHDYPFHSGFADQTGHGAGAGTTFNLPLAPGATWNGTYKPALVTAMQHIIDFGAQAVVVSMGLDTYDKDPCAIQRAGFCLHSPDYLELGQTIGAAVPTLPTVFLQEGGYRMDKIGEAAANVIEGFRSQRK
jgi:acetoin utilization deacetylase AcuC-like enzyme